MYVFVYTGYSILFGFFIWNSQNMATPLIIFACSSSSKWGEHWFIFWGGQKQNEYFLYFLRNTGRKIDVTFVLALEKYGRNMAALGSSLAALSFPLWLFAQKLAMKNSSASRNDISIWKCWALCFPHTYFSLSLSLSIAVALSFLLSFFTYTLDSTAMTVSARNISPAAYFEFWVNFASPSPSLRLGWAAMVARPCQTFWHAIYHLSSML